MTQTLARPATVEVASYADPSRFPVFTADATVQDYLDETGVEVGDGMSVSLNGEPATTQDVVREPGAIIDVAPLISNG